MPGLEHPMQTILPASLPAAGSGALIVDVRTAAEFAALHLPGSVLIPLDALEPGKVRELMVGKSACLLMCQSGGRASRAAEKLRAAGLDNVLVVEGGIQACAAAGLPVSRGRGVISLERQVRIVAGLLVLTGATLAWFVHPAWVGLSAFVGAGLTFAGITDFCGMGLLLARMPWNTAGKR
jgi:rhodanese-related sulfurtransferase